MKALKFLPSSFEKYTVTAMPINIGIIGSGRIIERVHLPAFSKNPEVNVAAIAGRNLEQLPRLCRKFDIPSYSINWKAMLRDERLKLDAVSIATPNALHADMILFALRQGMHVLVEKPMAVNDQEADEIIKISTGIGKFVMVQQTLRFNYIINMLRSFIQKRTIGNIKAVSITHGHMGPLSEWYYNKDLAGGGVLFDLGVHAIDTIRYLFPEEHIKILDVNLSNVESGIEHDAVLHILLQKRDEETIVGPIELSWTLNEPIGRINLVGEKGIIYATYWPFTDQSISVGNKGHETHIVDSPEVKYEINPFDHFISSILHGKQPKCSCMDNAQSLIPIFNAYKLSSVL